MLLFLGDAGCSLDKDSKTRADLARRTLCTFHGLLRWCRRVVSDPSKGFDSTLNHTSGQNLLVRLAMLP